MKRFILFLFLLAFMSCMPQFPDTDKLVNEIYTSKVEDLNRSKWNDCLEHITQDAKQELDSIVHRLTKADLMDTIDFPSKPIRPQAPDHIIGKSDRFDGQ